MEILLIVFEKMLFIFLLMFAGALTTRLGILSEETRRQLSRLLIELFWPALIFSSIVGTLSTGDILSNLWLPLLALVTVLSGYFLSLLVARLKKYEGDSRKLFLYHGSINNFVFLVLPFVDVFLPEKGAGLLFVHNLGIMLAIWTLGVGIFKPGQKPAAFAKNLISPGLIATVAAILVVLTGLGPRIPAVIQQALTTLGAPSMAVSMLIAGAQIYITGRKALKFDSWNILVALLRLVVIPGLLLGLTWLLARYTSLPPASLVIFMLVNIMPVSLNSVSMALRYNTDPIWAARGVVFTHLFSIITIAFFLPLIKTFL